MKALVAYSTLKPSIRVKLLTSMLRFMDIQVDQRHVRIGETLTSYDFVFIQLEEFDSIRTNRYKWSAYYGLLVAKDPIIIIDKPIFTRMTPPHIERILKCDNLSDTDYLHWEKLINYDEHIIEMFSRIRANGYHKIIYPAFRWGDSSLVEKLLKCGKVFTFDPSLFYDLPNYEICGRERANKWSVMPSDSSKTFADKTDWIVTNRSFITSKGVLTPRQPEIDGIGWWRERFLLGLNAECVVQVDPRECRQLGIKGTCISDVESQAYFVSRLLSRTQKNILDLWSTSKIQATGNLFSQIARGKFC